MAKLTGAVAPKKDVVDAAKQKVADLKAKALAAKQKKAEADAAALAAAQEAEASDAEETEAEDEEAQDEALPDDEVDVPAAPVDPSLHLGEGVFTTPRGEGDAPVSTLKATDLHPVNMDALEDEGGGHDWVAPFPEKGVVYVRFLVATPIGRTWYQPGDVATIPAELAHSIHKQITGVGPTK